MDEDAFIDDGFTTCTVKQLREFLNKCIKNSKESGDEDTQALEALSALDKGDFGDEEVLEVEYGDWCGFLFHRKENE